MSEQNNQQLGDGSDNPAQAAKKAAEAAKQFGQSGAGQAASKGAEMGAEAAAKGAEAGANAAAATVKAGVEGGKAVAEIATGTAAGGPWGAVIAAAWAMRHTLFKILICVCLMLVFLVALVVSLPSILFNNIFRTDPATVDTTAPTDMFALYDDLTSVVSGCISDGYDYALAEVERIIAGGGYNYEYSMEALINYGHVSADYDTCYVLAAYSASMEQKGTTKQDLKNKLDSVKQRMFPVTYEVKSIEVTVPAEDEDSEPTTETIYYVQCTIHPFDQSVILSAFSIDSAAQYNQFSINYGDAINNMANSLKMTLYGTMGSGSVPPITDAELAAFLARLDCSPVRKELMRVALSLVGRVPYFWGGKSAAGWNPEWNTPRLVTSAGSSSSGTIRPYGLDCSGFTDWVYKTALDTSLHAGSSNQWDNSYAITEAELLPGDLGFMEAPGVVDINHVLLYAGKNEAGEKMWVHCSSGTGVVLNSPTYVKHYRRVNDVDLEGSLFAGGGAAGEPLYSLRVDVTHYCACSKCCGANAKGITASGKQVVRGMAAMSSYYPFGTQIMINGIMYTVEDRGGSGIENNTARVDIFVPDHQEALRLGRFQTEAQIYRIGR